MPAILDFLISFSAVLWEALPFIVLGAVVAGILEEFLPQELLTRVLPKSVVPAVMIGAVLGLVFPMCECGIVVVMRRLLRKGLPLSCCIAYMLAGPIINGVVIFSTWVAFKDHKIGDRSIGPEMVGLRVGLAFLIACATGLIVHLQARKYGNVGLLSPLALPPAASTTEAPESPEGRPASVLAAFFQFKWVRLELAWWIIGGIIAVGASVARWVIWPTTVSELSAVDATIVWYARLYPALLGARIAVWAVWHPDAVKRFVTERLPNISSTALHDFVDITVFLILGAVLAALARQSISADQFETLSRDQPYLAIPAMMLLAFLMCLCSEADAFVAASFTKMHVTAKLAFLVLGPMLDIKLVLMYTRVFRLRLILTIIVCVLIQTLVLCMIVHLIYQANGWRGVPLSS